jgi:hypothetical protein
MKDEKRKGDKPVPDDVKEHLNYAQLALLRTIEGFGWRLKFVRRPLFREPVIVVTSHDDSQIGILEDDGRLNLDPGIDTRD